MLQCNIMQYNAIYNHNDAICNIYWKRMQYIAIIMQWKHFHITVSQSTTSHRCEQCKMFVTFNFIFRLHSYTQHVVTTFQNKQDAIGIHLHTSLSANIICACMYLFKIANILCIRMCFSSIQFCTTVIVSLYV